MNFPVGVARDQAVTYAVHEWARHDLQAAAAWTGNLGEGDAQTLALKALIGGWAGKDSEAAMRWAATLPEGIRADALQLATRFAEIQDEPALTR